MLTSNIRIEKADPESTEARALFAQSDAYMADRYPAESNHLEDSKALLSKNVLFLGAYINNELAACGAVKQLHDDSDYGEIKRLFVVSKHRGKGLSRLIMQKLEAHLREHGIPFARLETGASEPAALGLYKSLGYVERSPFGNYRHDPLSVFMEKKLTDE